MKKIIIVLVVSVFIQSCTENMKAKNFGGSAEVSLPANQKLVNVTWKDDDLWYITRPMHPTDSAETYTFHEESSFGVWEGTYTIKEVKQ